MKTTIDIDDDLLKAAKKRAIDEGTTLRKFLEIAIRDRLSGASGPGIYGGFATRAELYDEATFEWLEQFGAEVQKHRRDESAEARAS